jgi:hypothetical protein
VKASAGSDVGRAPSREHARCQTSGTRYHARIRCARRWHGQRRGWHGHSRERRPALPRARPTACTAS